VASFKTTDAGFDIEYDFSIQGFDLRSSAQATVKGAGVRGEYRTTARGDGAAVDAGKFQAKAPSE
jgi:hypothetical protein